MDFKFFRGDGEQVSEGDELIDGLLHSIHLGLDNDRPYRARVLYPGGEMRTFYSEISLCSYNQLMDIINSSDNLVYQIYAVMGVNDVELFSVCDPSDIESLPNFFVDNPNLVHKVEYVWFPRV